MINLPWHVTIRELSQMTFLSESKGGGSSCISIVSNSLYFCVGERIKIKSHLKLFQPAKSGSKERNFSVSFGCNGLMYSESLGMSCQ